MVVILYITAETNCVGLKLEIMNRDVVGSLINLYKNETGSRVFVRSPLNEYSIEDVKVSHETVDFFVSSQKSDIIVSLLDDLHNQGILDNITEMFPLLWPPSFTTPDIYLPDETDLKVYLLLIYTILCCYIKYFHYLHIYRI